MNQLLGYSHSGQKVIAAHKMVAEVAKSAAGELYDTLMGDNQYFDMWKKQNPDCSRKELEEKFIAKNWPRCIPLARATLVGMLKTPIPEWWKEEIIDALAKDATLLEGRPENRRGLNI